MRVFVSAFCAAIFILCSCRPAAAENGTVVIFGSTASGVMAAVAVARNGARPVLLAQTEHVGGLVSGGLSATDEGKNRLIGGLARETFKRIGAHYGKEVEWNFEPHVAEGIFRALLAEHKVTMHTGFELERVEKREGRISAVVSRGGKRVEGDVFIDASYEGDLLAGAGVAYAIGRESKAEFSERLAGFQPEHSIDQFLKPVSGRAADGSLLKGVREKADQEPGDGDKRISAFNYRLCVTDNAAKRAPFPRPKVYRESDYELLLRYFEALPTLALQHLFRFLKLQNGKFDLNNTGPFSSDLIGGGERYFEANPEERKRILQEHYDHLAGLWWTLNHHERVPAFVREQASHWGLCSDEFVANGNWPPQLYIREGRRMRGVFVLSEKDVVSERTKPDSVGMGSKYIESHHVQRYLDKLGNVFNEGFVYPKAEGQREYEIPYRSLVPKKSDARNLLVPVSVSATHVAFSSLRMEPVYMILGHSTGVAAVMALRAGIDVQDVDVQALQTQLLHERQVLHKPETSR